MKENYKLTYCVSLIDYEAYKRKGGILSSFYILQRWNYDQSRQAVGEKILIHKKKNFLALRKQKME